MSNHPSTLDEARAPVPRDPVWRGVVGLIVLAQLPLLAAASAGRVPAGFDVIHEKWFWRTWCFDRLAVGELPLWNPWVLAGYPMHADPVQGIFYPPNWIHLLLPHALAIAVGLLLHALLAARGCYRLVLALGGGTAGAALAAVAFPLGGFWTGHVALGELPHLHATAWAPWLTLFALEGVRGRRRSWLLLGAAGTAATLAGHLQYAYQATVFAGVVALAFALGRPAGERAPALARAALGGAIAAALALSMTAVQLGPTAVFLAESDRGGGLSWSRASIGSFPPVGLLRLLVPGFFGDADTSVYWGGLLHGMATPFVGLAPLVFLPFAFRRGAHGRAVAVALAAPTALALALALGGHTPIYRALAGLLPGLELFRLPVRWLGMLSLGLAILGGLGFGSALRVPGRAPRAAALVGLPLILLALPTLAPGAAQAGSAFQALRTALHGLTDPWMPPGAFEATASAAAAVARRAVVLELIVVGAIGSLVLALRTGRASRRLVLGAVLLLTAAEETVVGTPAWRTVPAASLATPGPVLDALRDGPHDRSLALFPLSAAPHTPAFLESYGSLNRFSQSHLHRAMLERRREAAGVFFVGYDAYRLLTGVAIDFAHQTIENPVALDRLGVRWVLVPATPSPPPLPLAWPELRERGVVEGVRILENGDALPRARLARRVERLPDERAVLARLADATLPPDVALVLDPRPPPSAEPAVPFGPSSVRFLEDAEERVVIEVEHEGPPRMLVLADSFAAGWRASVDGSAVPIERVDLALRGVTVAAGRHRVVFEYRPASVSIGAAASLAGALAWLIAWFALRRAARGRPAGAALSGASAAAPSAGPAPG